MDITTLEPVIYIDPQPFPFDDSHRYVGLDIDKDRVMDVKIESVNAIRNTYISKESWIEVINDSYEISVIEMPDAFRICMDTINAYSNMNYNTYTNYSCFGEGKIDSIAIDNIYYH